jgi:transcriptional regulator GlxA family with amidase domain
MSFEISHTVSFHFVFYSAFSLAEYACSSTIFRLANLLPDPEYSKQTSLSASMAYTCEHI